MKSGIFVNILFGVLCSYLGHLKQKWVTLSSLSGQKHAFIYFLVFGLPECIGVCFFFVCVCFLCHLCPVVVGYCKGFSVRERERERER